MNLFSRLFNKPAEVSLLQVDRRVLLGFAYDGFAASFRETAEHWPELGIFALYARPELAVTELSLDQLPAARQAFWALRAKSAGEKRLRFLISAELERLEFRDRPPEDFQIRYVPAGGGLRRALPEGTMEFGAGWMRRGDACWRYPQLSAELWTGLMREEITGQSLVRFLSQDLEEYRAADVPVSCAWRWEARPALAVRVEGVEPDRVGMAIDWRADPAAIDPAFELDGYVLADGALRPGISPVTVARVLGNVNGGALRGEAIARFLDAEHGRWRPFMTGALGEFDRLHRFVNAPCQWVLVARAKETRGVGRVYAHPYACVGHTLIPAASLFELQKRDYARLPDGWVRGGRLRALGMDADGLVGERSMLKPIALSADLLICRGGARLDGPFAGMRLEGAKWRASGSRHACVEEHLAYLLHWGVSGGVTGGYEAFIAYGLGFLRQSLVAEKGGRVLLLGSREDLAALRRLPFLGEDWLAEKAIQTLSYEALRKDDGQTRAVKWDLVLMIEPDAAGGAALTERASLLAGLSAACRIGFFCKRPPTGTELEARCAELLGCKRKLELAGCLIRDGRHPLPLPAPYVFTQADPALAEALTHAVYLEDPAANAKASAPAAERKAPLGGRRDTARDAEAARPADAPLASSFPGERLELRPTQITLNLEDVDRLRRESDEVREALIASVGETPAESESPMEPEAERTEATPEQKATPEPDDAWRAFYEAVEAGPGLEALEALLAGGEAFQKWAATHGEMTELLLDKLNELAADALGDLIGDAEGVLEEYRDAVSAYLTKRQDGANGE